MKERAEFRTISENSMEQKLRFLLFIGFIAFILISISATMYLFAKQNPGAAATFKSTKDFVFQQTKSLSPIGLLYISFFGNILYSTLPVEFFFFSGLTKGSPEMLTFILVLCGIFASEIVNYLVGRKLSRFIFYIISPKKIYQAKRIANKYGSFAVFFFSFIPALPSPLLTFTLGIAKYKPSRLFPLLFIGAILKFGAILALFHFFNPWITSFFEWFK